MPMPLKATPKGASKATVQRVISKNIGELMKSGKRPLKQAVAIALSKNRESSRKKKGKKK